MGRGRAALTCALVLVACVAVAYGTSSQAAPGDPVLLPDLVADPPVAPSLEQYTSGGQTRLLLRFDGFVHNSGAGAADVRGSVPSGNEMTSVIQRLYHADGTWTESPLAGARVRFENEDGHNHWHLGEAARYSLWNAAKTAEVAPAMKVGFCLEDSEHRETHGPATAVYSDGAVRFCQHNSPAATAVHMGISAGWRDVYRRTLAFQWVDASDVVPGSYRLRSDVDPNGVVQESDEQNAPAYAGAQSVIPGHVAQPLVRQGLEAGEPASLTLAATSFGAPGARQFRIESGPARGSLGVTTGDWFSGPEVTYTPDAGYSGADSFTYSARDSTSSFPLTPAVATVTLGVEQPPEAEAVAIGGAPARLDVGTSAQLTATVTNGPGDVVWSVNGIPGGSAAVGTITATGLYTAPAAAPPGGKVALRATTPSGAFAEVEVEIVVPPPPQPAPTPEPEGDDPAPDQGTPPADTKPPPATTPAPPLLSKLRVGRHARVVYVQVVAGRSGIVETKALVGSRRIALCRTRAPAGRPVVCRMSVSRRYRLSKTTIVAKLRVARTAVAMRAVKAFAGTALAGAHAGHSH